MTWIKNIGTWIAVAGGILLIYLKVFSGKSTEKAEEKIDAARKRIDTRNEENRKSKQARRELSGKALSNKSKGILNG